MAITLADFNKIWASTSPLTPYSFSDANYKEGWNFVGATPPSRQMWDFLQKNNDEKMQYLADNYLPKSGGTMTGELVFGSGTGQGHMAQSGECFRVSATKFLCGDNPGAGLVLRGRTATNDAGAFALEATSDSDSKTLVGKPNGTLTWGGVSLTDGTFIKTESVSITTTTSGTGGVKIDNITAPTVSGYQFVCWVYCVSEGAVFPCYPASPTNASTAVWGNNVTSGATVHCIALYVRKW